METIELKHLVAHSKGFEHGYFVNFGVVGTQVPKSIVFCTNFFYLQKALSNSNVSAIVLSKDLADRAGSTAGKVFLVSSNPSFEYWKLFNKMVTEGYIGVDMEYGIDKTCNIHPTAVISDKVFFGKDVVVGPQAVIGDYVILYDNVEIGSGVIVGTEGLQVAATGAESIHIRHAGGVRIGRNSKVLANSVIARGLFPEWTEIGSDTYIALLVSIGHQCKIGDRCQISSNVVVGGSARIGDGVSIGPSATISSSVSVGADARIKLGSVVIKDVDQGAVVSGNFAKDHLTNVKSFLSR